MTAAAPRSSDERFVVSRKVRYVFLAIAVVLTAVVIAVIPAMPWRETFAAIAEASPLWLLVAVLANIAIFPIWAWQWQLLAQGAHPGGWRSFLEIVALYSAARTTVPYLGLPSALALLMAVGRLPAGVAIGILTLDQLINGLAKIVLIALAVLLVPLPAWMRNGVLLLLGLTVAAFAALLMIAHASERLRAFAAGFSGLAAQLADQAAMWADHLKLLRNPSQAWPVLAIGIAKKGLELAAILAVQVACGIPLSIEIAVLALAALSVTTMLPAAPANLGVYEATVVFVYQSAGVPQPVALAAALLQHAAVLAPSLAVGAIALLVHHRRSSRAAR